MTDDPVDAGVTSWGSTRSFPVEGTLSLESRTVIDWLALSGNDDGGVAVTMIHAAVASFAIAVSWLCAVVAAWLSARRWAGRRQQARPRLVIAVAAAIARAGPALLLDRGFAADLDAHWSIGMRTLAGQDVYLDPLGQDRYPYPPLHRYVSALMVVLSGHDRAAFTVVDKLVPALYGRLTVLGHPRRSAPQRVVSRR